MMDHKIHQPDDWRPQVLVTVSDDRSSFTLTRKDPKVGTEEILASHTNGVTSFPGDEYVNLTAYVAACPIEQHSSCGWCSI